MTKKWTNKRVDNEVRVRCIRCLSNLQTVDQPSTTKVAWQCAHRHKWQASVYSVVRGSGCPFCAGNKKQTIKDRQQRLDAENRNIKIKRLFPGSKNHEGRGEFECGYCNHIWTAILSNVYGKRQGCPRCGKTGRYNETYFRKRKGERGQLYLLEFFDNEERFIKIGITKRTISARFQPTSLPYEYKIVDIMTTTLYAAWKIEQQIVQCFSEQKYLPRKKFGGNGECFQRAALRKIRKTIMEISNELEDQPNR